MTMEDLLVNDTSTKLELIHVEEKIAHHDNAINDIVEMSSATTVEDAKNNIGAYDDNPTMRQAGGSRQSTTLSHSPIWMKDYVTQVSKSHPYSQSNYVSYDNVSSQYRVYLSVFSTEVEPKSYEEAVKDKRWVYAMQKEVQAL